MLGNAETIGLLQTLLDGGLPLLLLVALICIAYMYKREKEAKDKEVAARVKAVETHSVEMSKLQVEYSAKVESLMRERLQSEKDSQKVILENGEVMKAAVMTMTNCNDTLQSVIEE